MPIEATRNAQEVAEAAHQKNVFIPKPNESTDSLLKRIETQTGMNINQNQWTAIKNELRGKENVKISSAEIHENPITGSSILRIIWEPPMSRPMDELRMEKRSEAASADTSSVAVPKMVSPEREVGAGSDLMDIERQTSKALIEITRAIGEIPVWNMSLRESFSDIGGLVTSPFTGPKKFNELLKMSENLQNTHNEFASDLLKAHRYMIDFKKGQVDGRELPELMENMMSSYGNFNTEMLKLKEKVDEYHVDKASEAVGAAVDVALTVGSVAGATAVARAGGSLILKQGLKGAASAATREGLKGMGKGALEIAKSKAVWGVNIAFASSAAGVELWKEHNMAQAVQQFQEEPREGIRTMENFLDSIEIQAKGNRNEPQIREFIAKERELLNGMSEDLNAGHEIDYAKVAKTFALTLVTSVAIEAGFGAAGAVAKGVKVKPAAPVEKKAPAVIVAAKFIGEKSMGRKEVMKKTAEKLGGGQEQGGEQTAMEEKRENVAAKMNADRLALEANKISKKEMKSNVALNENKNKNEGNA
jgi:hypothetical protein